MTLTSEELREVYDEVSGSERYQQLLSEREERTDSLRPWVRSDLNSLSDEELRQAFEDYYDDGGAAQTLNKINLNSILEDIPQLRQTLEHLLDREIPVEDRLNSVLSGDYSIEGLGKAVASHLLMISDSERHCIWNNKTEAGLERLGREPAFDRGSSIGDRYLSIREAVGEVQDLVGASDYLETDLFLHFVGAPEPEAQEALAPYTTEGGSELIRRVLEVVDRILEENPATPGEVREARIAATKSVAQEEGIDQRTVADECSRRLEIASIQAFDDLVLRWLLTRDASLKDTLVENCPDSSQASDIPKINSFFEKAGQEYPQPRIYKIAPGRNAEFWDECREGNRILVGWDEIGDLDRFEGKVDFLSEFEEATSYGSAQKESEKANELWSLNEIKKGDIVLCNQGESQILAAGRVTEPYNWDEEREEFRHTLSVNWDTSVAQELEEPVTRWRFKTIEELEPSEYIDLIGSGQSRDPDFWWVNQGQSYTSYGIQDFLFAPRETQAGGSPRFYWENLTELNVGDIVFHYADKELRAVSRVTAPSEEVEPGDPVPEDVGEALGKEEWERSRWFVRVDAYELDDPLPLTEIPNKLRQDEGGPFQDNGAVKQGYLFPLSDNFARELSSLHSFPLPEISELTMRETDLEHVQIEDFLVDRQALERATTLYAEWRDVADEWDESYKWEVLEEIHQTVEGRPWTEEVAEDFAEALLDATSRGSPLAHLTELYEVRDFVREDPAQAAEAFQLLLDEETDLETRIREFRDLCDLASQGIAYVLAGADPTKYAPYWQENFEWFLDLFVDHRKPNLGALSVPEKQALFQRTLRALRDEMESYGVLEDPELLDAHDFVTCLKEPSLRMNVILEELQAKSKFFRLLEEDPEKIVDLTRSLPTDYLQERREDYRDTDQKILQIRENFLIALLEDRPIKADEWKREVEEATGSSIGPGWNDFRIFSQVLADFLGDRVDNYMDAIGTQLCKDLDEEDLVASHVTFTSGAGKPHTTPWVTLYPAENEDHREAYQLFLTIHPDGLEGGLYPGTDLPDRARAESCPEIRDELTATNWSGFVEELDGYLPKFREGNEALRGEKEEAIFYDERFDAIATQLQKRKQVIFHGPPGTGKTFTAIKFAEWWLQNDDPEVDPVEDRYEVVTFHPAFSYEDFIEGITAETKNGDVQYRMDPGVFKDFCTQAEEAWEEWDGEGQAPKYVLVIDEINRGNLPQILGEVITLLEDDKRIGEANEVTVNLSHSKAEFGIPPNVFVIGTMNTADQSIALLDAAIRRRFRFMEFPPDYDHLLDYFEFESGEDARELARKGESDSSTLQALSVLALQAINDRIRAVGNLGKGKQVGHTYLRTGSTREALAEAWRYEILPLLQEYFFGEFGQMKKIIFDGEGDRLFDAERQEIKDFGPEDLQAELEAMVAPSLQDEE